MSLVCPYCLNDKKEDEKGCCGESSAHFVEMTDDEFINALALDLEHANKLNGEYKI